jgi:hypothetical protein
VCCLGSECESTSSCAHPCDKGGRGHQLPPVGSSTSCTQQRHKHSMTAQPSLQRSSSCNPPFLFTAEANGGEAAVYLSAKHSGEKEGLRDSWRATRTRCGRQCAGWDACLECRCQARYEGSSAAQPPLLPARTAARPGCSRTAAPQLTCEGNQACSKERMTVGGQ